MSQNIAVIDYGMGNLHSVAKAIEHVLGHGDQVRVTDDPDYIRDADRVVFPGQGAARDCMAAINQHHVRKAVLSAAAEKPMLGICMGLQVLLTHSEENEGTELLGLFPGKVRFFGGCPEVRDRHLKIPHMGWNRVRQAQDHPLWTDIPEGSRFYFVHSYFVEPQDPGLSTGSTDYGVTFTSALARANLFAVQFHPEKSADRGLQLLANFVRWNP